MDQKKINKERIYSVLHRRNNTATPFLSWVDLQKI